MQNVGIKSNPQKLSSAAVIWNCSFSPVVQLQRDSHCLHIVLSSPHPCLLPCTDLFSESA